MAITFKKRRNKMKTKTLEKKKLVLKKKTISHLNHLEMDAVNGGGDNKTITCAPCGSELVTCAPCDTMWNSCIPCIF
jgi:hypothetical protein